MISPELIRFNVLRNALYHTARRRRLERVNRVFNFAIILAGTAVVSELVDYVPFGREVAGVLVAVIGALQLVFDFGRQARDHQQFQRDYYYLLADIERAKSIGPDEVAEFQARMIQITADEPPTLKALDAKAYNDALDATSFFPRDQRLIIPWHHQIFGAFFAYDGHEYRTVEEASAGSVGQAPST
jgi:hypothetical protein